MNVQGYQKMTLLDYPGRVACTVFTGGCNLRCPFCHNAGLVQSPTAYQSAEGDVLDYLAKRRGLLDGVCVTGGEPLLQQELAEFLERVRGMGFSVKLDTNGTLPDRLEEILSRGLVDYVAMDVKSSPQGYAAAVGCECDVGAIERSMRLIRESGLSYEFRTTAVKGIHTVDDFSAIGAWLDPRDPYFIQCFVDSGNLLGAGVSAFCEEEMQAILGAVTPYLPQASLRGVS
jgi:pyruvate formate lyase activating enzyme